MNQNIQISQEIKDNYSYLQILNMENLKKQVNYESIFECTICLEDIYLYEKSKSNCLSFLFCNKKEKRKRSNQKQICKLSCSHIYHVDCIFDWICNQKTCPNCRSELKKF
jgi:hypothetical protein